MQMELIEPLENYLKGMVSEEDVDWSDWKWDVRNARKEKSRAAVRNMLTPYYHRLFMADKSFFHNGNSDMKVKNNLLTLIKEEGVDAGRLFNDLDVVKAAENWAERLSVDNHEPRFFFLLLQNVLTRGYQPEWNLVFEELKKKLAKVQQSGDFKRSEMHCLLMGVTMIEMTDCPREKKERAFRAIAG